MYSSCRQRLKTFIIITAITFTVINIVMLRSNNEQQPKTFHKPRPTKTILLWNSLFELQDYYFGLGNMPFIEKGCSNIDCRIDRNVDGRKASEYDAVIFHAPEFNPQGFNASRKSNQIYVYLALESPANRPVDSSSNSFYNATMTYRIDSDVVLPYFYFIDKQGKTISSSEDPKWMEPDFNNMESYIKIHKTKKKMAAWFVSHCVTSSHREVRVQRLKQFVEVDVYGTCGPLKCPRSNEERCFDLLKSDYLFYISYENSLCKDYVTEKSANAYRHDAIPIVYNGANVTRFLPPHSYIDATHMSEKRLAKIMKYLRSNPEEYAKYFWWRKYYSITTGPICSWPAFCKLCEMLHENNPTNKVYRSMKEWWHGNEQKPICSQ